MKILRLDDVEPTRLYGSLWKPIRSTLGIRAFGINAYVAERAGDPLFNEHDETEAFAGDQRHEFVVTGRATFTVDGQELDAAARTFVFVEDPKSRRGAVAAETDTLILAMGGPTDEAYRPAPWEGRFLAERERLTSDRARRQA